MLVKRLSETEYDKDGWTWRTHDIPNPTWDQIEASIWRLDKFRFPFVWLYLDGMPESDVPQFEVTGGSGDYVIACSVKDYRQRLFCDPSRGKRAIEIWTSDQGGSNAAENVLHDLDVVLRVTRYFCDTGDFDPSIPWDNGCPPRGG